jgi:chorismate mutase-like protein
MSEGPARSTPPAWTAALRRLDAPEPGTADTPTEAAPTEADLVPWRERIDAIDEAVILLLNERARYAAQIGRIKRAIGLPVYVPSREEEVLQHVIRASPGPLPGPSVRRLFERIIDETRALERRLHDDRPAPEDSTK